MTRILTMFALAATATLAACDRGDQTIVTGPGTDEAPISTENVELPPSISASHSYRCKDNSLVYIDWLSDGSARVKAEPNATGTAPAEGELTGDAAAQTITYKGQSCKR